MNGETYRDKIVKEFYENEVEGSQIDELKEKTRKVLLKIVEDIEKTLMDKFKEIESILNEKGSNFTKTIENYALKEVDKLKKDLENIEESKNRYKDTIFQIENFQNKLKGE